MPMVTPDFTDTRKELTEGVHEAKIVSVEQRTSQAGNPCLNWKLSVGGNTVFYTTPLTGGGAWRFKQMVRAAVSPGYDGGPINTDPMINKIINVDLVKQENGKYWDVTKVAAIDDSFDSFEQTGS